MASLPRLRSGKNRQRGQALVEFALTMPVLFRMDIGILEFSVALAANIGVNRAAQRAALMASAAYPLRIPPRTPSRARAAGGRSATT